MQNAPYGDVRDFDKATFRSAPKFTLAFFVNGEVAFESDESFLTKPSPIVFDDLRAGEHYDARLETPKWGTQVCDEWKKSLQKQLLEVIKRDGEVFTTGVLGARVLFRVLSSMGEGDLAYKLITQPRFPSYGEHILRGARTLLENFFELSDGWQRKDGKKQDSLNHHFWGDVSAWFITCVAGIKVNPDFYDLDDVTIAPDFLSDLTFAQGKIEHHKGEIFCRWQRVNNEEIRLVVRLPKGINATLGIPNGYFCNITKLCAGEQILCVYKR